MNDADRAKKIQDALDTVAQEIDGAIEERLSAGDIDRGELDIIYSCLGAFNTLSETILSKVFPLSKFQKINRL